MKSTTITSCLLSVFALSLLPGCGGGAASVPSVTARPKRAQKTDDTGNGKTTSGGTSKGGVGSFTGKITFDGPYPEIGAPARFNAADTKNKACLAGGGKVQDLSLIVKKENMGVKDVFVYVYKTKVKLPNTPVPSALKLFDQKNCTFLTPAMIVRVGQKVEVRNSDQTSHNTHTYPLNAASSAYNKAISGGQKDEYTYGGDEKLPVKVTCDIHAWMLAHQLPLDHGFAALTDADGNFKIEGLPEGEYTMRIWHARTGYLKKDFVIIIDGGKPTTENYTMSASALSSFNGPQPKTVVLSFNK